jgi:hypothetical protein
LLTVFSVFNVLCGGYEIMTNAATLEALDSHIIRNILRSMANEHWSVAEALDEYDIPEELREEYEARIEECFVD